MQLGYRIVYSLRWKPIAHNILRHIRTLRKQLEIQLILSDATCEQLCINTYMIIYETVNKVNLKYYIGKDENNNPAYLGSGLALGRAIKKYGKENFTKKVVEVCTDSDTLAEREKFWIKERGAVQDPQSYNIHYGGRGGNTGAYHKVGRSGKLNAQWGRVHTNEENLAQSVRMKEWHKNEDPTKKEERIRKSSESQKGRIKADSEVANIKASKEKYWNENEVSLTLYNLISPTQDKFTFRGLQELTDWCKENNYSIWTVQCRLLRDISPKSGSLVGWTATSTHEFTKIQKAP